MAARKLTKHEKIVRFINRNPNATDKAVATKFAARLSTVARAREEVIANQPDPVEGVIDTRFGAELADAMDYILPERRQEGGTHYTEMKVQPWDVVDSWTLEQRIGYFRGNAIKYLMRLGSKDSLSLDIAKAHHYVSKLMDSVMDV
jgi:hypothetical protein